MGYIKKLKNNELVGGTDKATIYPVTSTKAVFEEVSENNFQSQEYLNNHIYGGEGGRINKESITDYNIATGTVTKEKLSPQVQTMLDEGQKKALTPKGDYNPEDVYEALDLVFDRESNSSYVSLITPNTEPLTNEDAWEMFLDGTAVNTAQATINDKVDELDAQVDQAIEDARQELQDATDAANGAAELAMDVVANKVADAQIGYFECNTVTGTALKQTTLDYIGTGNDKSYYTIPAAGSNVRIKMKYANTASGTAELQFGTNTATRKQLIYNGEPASNSNSWDAGEVLSIYYDPTYNNNVGAYQASNAQGGGGKAEKIKYDNSQSGLLAENVQGALDSAAEMLYADQETDVPIGNDGTHYNVAISGGSWVAKTNSRDQKCNLIKVNEGEVYKIIAKTSGSYQSSYAWLTTSNHTAGEPADFLTGYEQVILVDVGSYTKTIVPEGAEYMYIGWVVNDNDRLPSKVSRTITIKKDTKNINAKIDALSDTIGVSPLYSNNQSLEITNGTLYPRSAAICTGTSWTTSGESRSIFIPVGNAKTMSVTANDDVDAAVGFVTKVYASGDTSPQWASGWSEVLRITAGEPQELSVPTDSKYLYVGLKSSTGVVLMPESVDVVDVNTIDESLNQLADNDTVINGDISAINEELYEQGPATIYAESEELDLSAYTLKEGVIATENVWKISGMQAHIMIPIGNALSFSIVSNSSSATSYAWLTEDEDAAPNAQPKYAEGETGKRTIDMGETDYTLPTPPPSDAAYLYITAMGTSGNNVLPSKIIVASIDPNYVPPRNVSRITLLEEGLEENTNKTNAILGNYEATDGDMNLNILKAGREDGAICYWWYPHIISTLMPHKRIYYTSVDTYGGTSVACVNGFDKRAWKTVLKRKLNNGEVDLHNTASIQLLSDNRLICIYTEGHSQTQYMHIRTTVNPEDITEWEYKAKIDWGGNATYSQYHYINGRHYIFSRVGYGNYNTNSWAFVYSDDLETWSEPHTFIVQSSNYQYYIWLKPIADRPNMLRFISYSNPEYSDTNIRCGVIDFENDKVYKHDGVTELTGSVNDTAGLDGTYSSSQFDVLVAKPSSGKQRMFDLAVTNLDTIRIAYGRQSSRYVGNYHVYENVSGVEQDTTICEAGDVIFNHNNTLSQCGIYFIDKNTLFVSKSSQDATGYDTMEIYKRGESGWAFDKEVYKELKGAGNYRNAYPIADPNGRYVMWMRGFLSQDTYAGSNTDVIIYDVEKDEIF